MARLLGQVRLYARKPHYRDHLLPVWNLLPDEYKRQGELERGDTILIAGGPDIRHGFPYIYLEHGAGQSYTGLDSSGYSGGSGHDDCRLFLCPSWDVAWRWKERYPYTPAIAIGCPRLDKYHRGEMGTPRFPLSVAITFHWDCTLLPETRSAFPHYRSGLRRMIDSYRHQGYVVLGHAHPRYKRVLEPFWKAAGVPWTDDPLRDAEVLIADNTSLMAEFATLKRPVVALNAPWYRKAIWHGERFWDWDVTYADTAEEAAALDLSKLRRPEWHPYAYADGRASERAVTAISGLLRSAA